MITMIVLGGLLIIAFGIHISVTNRRIHDLSLEVDTAHMEIAHLEDRLNTHIHDSARNEPGPKYPNIPWK